MTARMWMSLAVGLALVGGEQRMESQRAEPGSYSGPAGVRCHPDGRLFVVDDLAHQLVIVHPARPPEVLGGYGSAPGRLLYADAVHWRSDGALLIADTGANRIQVWAPDGRFLDEFGRPAALIRAAERLAPIAAIAFVGVGVVALALGIFASRTIGVAAIVLGILAAAIWSALTIFPPPALRNPRDIWVDTDDLSYVADFGSDVVRVFDARGRLLRTIGRPGSGPGHLRRPLGVTIDSAGQVLVTDSGNHRVQVFAKNGDVVRSVGEAGREPARFQSPHGIAVGPNGWWYVADRENHRVQILRADGSLVRAIDRAPDGTPFTPVGVCITPTGELVVSDLAGHRILRWPVGNETLTQPRATAIP